MDTDRINNYYFSATQPENMAEYDVWFPVGTSSPVAFSVTKKNPIMVYPLSAQQYIGGALVEKTTKSYLGGEWCDWVSYVYSDGKFTGISGFGVIRGGFYNNGNTFRLSSTKNEYTLAYSNERIHLSSRKSLSVTIERGSQSYTWGQCMVGLANVAPSQDSGSGYVSGIVAYTTLDNTPTNNLEPISGTFVVDCSGLNGDYYIVFSYGSSLDTVGWLDISEIVII